MTYTFLDFAPLLDFSQWETAIQSYFVATGLFAAPPDNQTQGAEDWQPPQGQTAFFTGFQAQVFTKARPRVDLGPINHTERDAARVIDVNGILWRNAWNVPIEFYVITKADYKTHSAFVANIRALIHYMNPDSRSIQTTGLNAYLDTHELAQIKDAGGPTLGGKWSADEDCFLTPLKYNAIFAVAAASWPGGTLNA